MVLSSPANVIIIIQNTKFFSILYLHLLPMAHPKADILIQLQKDILLLSGHKPPVQTKALPSGLPFMRQHFPQGIFSSSCSA
jgi:hypothetical protein